MAIPVSLDVYVAMIYFNAYMYGPLRGKLPLYRDRNVAARMVMSEDWEIFAALLLRRTGSGSQAGVDLSDIEVKSARDGGSFEYQYHRDSWQEKFKSDRAAGHIFISHRQELRHVDVRYVDGSDLSQRFFDTWEADDPYSDEAQQRFRRSVSFGWVRTNATLLLRIEDGEAVYVHGSP